MKYTPETVSAINIPIAQSPAHGIDKVLFISREEHAEVGEFEFTATGSGVWTPDPVTEIDPDAGADLVARVDGFLDADANVVVTVTGTDTSDSVLVGTASFIPPSYVKNAGSDFQAGIAFDVVTPGDATFKTVTNVTATNGKIYSAIKLYTMPSAASWKELDCVEDFNPKIGTHPAVNVPCGRDGTAHVIPGRSEPNNVTVNSKFFNVADGLMRYTDRRCSLRLDVKKHGRVVSDRIVLTGCILMVNPEFPDNDVSKQVAEGSFEKYFGFPSDNP